MTALLVVALALPLLAAAAGAALPGRAWLTPLAAGATALCWCGLAALDDPAELGRIVADPLAAVTVAGTAALVAGRPPASALARAAVLCGVTVLAVAACSGDGGVPDRALATGIAILSCLTALHGSGRAPGRVLDRVVSPALAGVALAVAVLVGEGAEAGVAGAAAAVVLLTLLARTTTGLVLLPAAVLATHRAAESAHAGSAPGWSPLAVAAAAGAAVVAVLLVVRSRRPSVAGRGRPWPYDRLPLAFVAAGIVLVAQDLPAWRSAGLLLAAGGVLATAAGVPLGLVAVLPGLAAAVEASALGTDPVHAVAGGAVVAVVMAAALSGRGEEAPADAGDDPAADRRPAGRVPLVLVAAAVAFGVVPLWGWSGARPDGFVPAVSTAAAGAAVALAAALTAGSVAALRSERGLVPTGSRWRPGRLQRRSNAVNHASTYPLVEEGAGEEAGPLEGLAEVPIPGEDGAGAAPQPPVATPARIVPRRAGSGGVRGRGRLRARPGRPA